MIHYIKIQAKYYARKLDGLKPFEIRLNDRDYQVGDKIVFEVIEDESGPFVCYEQNYWLITYVHSGLGLEDGYVVMTTVQENKKENPDE